MANPASPQSLAEAIHAIINNAGPHHSVALTGGEPLLYPDGIRSLAESLKGLGLGCYLETNGTLPDAMAHVSDAVDWVSMDIKLPSATGQEALWLLHKRFLEAASTVPAVFVKAVVAPDTEPGEVDVAASLVAEVDASVSFVIQPVTDAMGQAMVSGQRLAEMASTAQRSLSDVRIIPQTHKLLGLR